MPSARSKPPSSPKRTRPAVAYVRATATNSQAQVAKAARRRGLKLVATHGVAGDDAADAPGALAAALDQVCQERGVLVVESLTHLARSAAGCVRVSRRLAECGAALIAVREAIDTTTPAGRRFFALMDALGELELERSRLTRQAPFGFAFDESDEHLIVNAEEQAVLRRILEERSRGVQPAAIAKQLNRQKVRPRGAAAWDAAQVQEIVDRTATSRWTFAEGEI